MTLVRSVARLHGRQTETGSLCVRAPGALRRLISSTQGTRLGPYITPQTFELSTDDGSLASGKREYDDGEAFFRNFPDVEVAAVVAGRRVLDLGCGFGGRTVWYAERGAERVMGLEISPKMVDRCRAFAEQHGMDNVEFVVGIAEDLPYEDNSIDVVITYDVLEHVQDPAQAMCEIARVLQPDGSAWLVFPSYLGGRASHLDYLTQIPFLHRVFDPDVIIPVVNESLTTEPERYGVKAQPPARVTPVGRRALPTLNGMNRAEAEAFLDRAGLEVEWSHAGPLFTETARLPLSGPASRAMDRLGVVGRVPDALVGHLAYRVRRRG